MKKKLLLLLAMASLINESRSKPPSLKQLHSLYVEFEKGMGKGYPYYKGEKQHKTKKKYHAQIWNFLSRVYRKNNFLTIKNISDTPKIPKIIHQIWLGSPFPKKYEKWQQSWIKHNPDWEYRLWTDKDIEEFGLYNKDLFNRARNYGEKSDIARNEIIYRYGGIYVDTDFECLKSFDSIVHTYDFFIGLVPLNCVSILGNGIIGAAAGNKILKHCIETLHENNNLQGSVLRTGAGPLTKSFLALAEKTGERNIAFPTNYFHPLRKNYWKTPYPGSIQKESFAVHHWEASWAPKKK